MLRAIGSDINQLFADDIAPRMAKQLFSSIIDVYNSPLAVAAQRHNTAVIYDFLKNIR
jgi:hypothetical protein